MPKKQRGKHGSVQDRIVPSGNDGRAVGQRHFQAGRFEQAISAWQPLSNDSQVRAAIAEAYFRQALATPDMQSRADALRMAIASNPNDPRLHYHLGLTLHRGGDLKAAQEHYAIVAASNTRFAGLARVQALAAIEQGTLRDLDSFPGLSSDDKQALAPVIALLAGRTPPDTGDAASGFWRSLGLLQAGDAAGAATALKGETTLPAKLAPVRRYYLGVAEALTDDISAALDALQRVYNQQYITPWLLENLAAVRHTLLQEKLDAGDLEGAALVAQDNAPLPSSNPALSELQLQVLNRAAQRVAARGDWAQASVWWEAARAILSANATLGSPRPLLHNLALSYEAQERWVEAAEAWRAMLRTKPRKMSKTSKATKDEGRKAKASETVNGEQAVQDAPISGSPSSVNLNDEQWSWVRKRVIECYKHAGEPGEAVTVFRQAIKAEPDDIDLRIQLSDALLANDQPAAAHNELQRILEQDPNHIEARLRLSAYYASQDMWQAAEQSLRPIIEQHPERADVRRQLAFLLSSLGNHYNQYGSYDAAYQAFSEAAAFAPDDYEQQINLARVSFNTKRREEAAEHIEQALRLGADKPEAYVAALGCWAFERNMDEVKKIIARAEAALPPTPEFFVEASIELLELSAPPPALSFSLFGSPPVRRQNEDNEWSQLAEELLDRVAAQRPDDVDLRHRIASELIQVRPELGLRYIVDAVRLEPNNPTLQVLQGILQGLTKDVKGAKETLRKAIRLAKQQGNQELAANAEEMRRQIGTPFFGLAFQMGSIFDEIDDDAWF